MSVAPLKIHFALSEHGLLVTIDDINQRGLKCNCTCICCGTSLVANLGKVKRPHFSHHHTANNCSYSAETDLHLAAKEYVRSHKIVLAPEGFFEESGGSFFINFVQMDYEKPIKPLKEIPDLIGYTEDGEKIIVEIAVTHFCDATKIARYKKENLTAIEFDLSSLLPWAVTAKGQISDVFSKRPGKWLSICSVTSVAKRVIEFERQHSRALAKKIYYLNQQISAQKKEYDDLQEIIVKKRPVAESIERKHENRLQELEEQFKEKEAQHNEDVNRLNHMRDRLYQQISKLEEQVRAYVDERKAELEQEYKNELDRKSADIINAYNCVEKECSLLEAKRDEILEQLTTYERRVLEISQIKSLLNQAYIERLALVDLEPKLKALAQSHGIPWPLSKSISDKIVDFTRIAEEVSASVNLKS